jgi:fluoride exporter
MSLAAMPWATMLAVAAGAALGALLRWRVGLWLEDAWHGFPLGTLAVNCAGGLMMGAAISAFIRTPAELTRMFFVTGFLGGLTTFSAFSGESLGLLHRGQWGLALLHTLAHVLGALACTALGFLLMRGFWRG